MKYIHELFEAQVEQTPDAVAVAFKEDGLTYRELNEHADALAQHLRELGVRQDVLVALFLERSLDMVVGMLAVLKAGGAYVPLDPHHPAKRLAYMLADAQPLVLLTQARLQPALPPHRAHVVLIDADAHPAPVPVSGQVRNLHDLAYVIYTSGSTGDPKGVEIEHRSVVNMLASMLRRPGLSPEDAVLAITTLTFDIAVLEIFLPLICGARLVVAPQEAVGDGAALAALIERADITVLQATPSTLRMLLDAGWRGSPTLKVLCGGEAWTTELADAVLARCGSLWNMYGPTETTVWSAVARVEAGRPVVVGPPVARTRLYVLDGAAQLVPVGVAGELHIGGDGLARGYLHRPQLTQERFLPDPFSPTPGTRMYRTGDLVRRQPDGTLEFLGRLDHQVKIRGHRIELGEIEATLERLPDIARCVVLAREDVPGDQRLVAYIIPAAGAAVVPGKLRLLLGETLPAYMIPSAFVTLAAFPLTPNGKLDRKALPPPGAAAQEETAAPLAPRSPTEKVLARIWGNMLGSGQVGVRDNFFDLGGHSLLAVRVVGEINKTLQLRLTIPAFFQNPTIEQLAQVLDEQAHEARSEPRLVSLQPGRSGLPVYFIGSGPAEYQLAQLLGAHRAISAVDIPISAEWDRAIAAADRAALPTLDHLGTLCGNVVHAHAGATPCVIVGHSFGGKVAFEAAHAIRKAGGKVALVVLLDAWASFWSGTTRGPGWQSLVWIWRNAASGTDGAGSSIARWGGALVNSCLLLWWFLTRLPHVVKNRLRPAVRPSGFFDENGNPVDQMFIGRLVRLVGKAWRPSPLDTPGVLFRAKFPGEEMLPGYDVSNGWRGLFSRGLEIIESAGDHVSMVVGDENLAALAQQIAAVLDRDEAVRSVRPARAGSGTDVGFTAQAVTP